MESQLQEIVPIIIESLEKRYGSIPKPKQYLPVLDLLILYVIQREEALGDAYSAYQRIQEEFVDWNEVRITHPREISEILQKSLCHQVQEKAFRIREILSNVFHLCNKMDLEFLWEKDFSEIQRFLEQFPDIGEDFICQLITYCYYKTGPFLTSTAFRVGKRIGLWGENISTNTLRKSFSKNVGYNSFVTLHSLLFLHGRQSCLPKGYDCFECVLSEYCSRGREETAKQAKSRKKIKKIDEDADSKSHTITRAKQRKKIKKIDEDADSKSHTITRAKPSRTREASQQVFKAKNKQDITSQDETDVEEFSDALHNAKRDKRNIIKKQNTKTRKKRVNEKEINKDSEIVEDKTPKKTIFRAKYLRSKNRRCLKNSVKRKS